MGCNCDDTGTSEINSTDCTTDTPCTPVSTAPCSGISVCSCGCDTCQCESARGAGNQPFYNQAATCQEDHTKVLVNQNYVTAVTIGAAINMPACDGLVTAVLPGVLRLQVGSFLWNVTYGYLRVVSYDFTTGRVVLANDCLLSNAAPGTPIPACTMFNVVDPPYVATGDCDGEGVYVTANFTAPAVGASVTISVTGTEGLLLNGTVQVGAGVYQLTAIITSTSVTIKNTGGGVAAGTTVYAKNALGDCITPVVPYEEDPCLELPTTPGALVICADGNLTTLNAFATGQVPVVVDADTNEVEFQTLDVPTIDCTELTSCLNLISGTDTYTLVVQNSSIFYVGQLVVIKDLNLLNMFWLVTANPDATHIVVQSTTPNFYTLTIPIGTEVCEAFCCDQLDYELSKVINEPCTLDWSSAQQTSIDYVWDADQPGGGGFVAMNAGNPPYVSATKEITFSNPTCNSLQIFLTVDYIVQMECDVNESDWIRMLLQPHTGQSTAVIPATPAAPVQAALRSLYEEKSFGIGPGSPCDSFGSRHFMQYHHSEVITLPANRNLRYNAHLEFTYVLYKRGLNSCCACSEQLSDASGIISLTNVNTYIHAIGVAVQGA